MFFAAIGVETHIFEPMSQNLNALRCTVAANHAMAERVRINPFGLGHKTSDSLCMVSELIGALSAYNFRAASRLIVLTTLLA